MSVVRVNQIQDTSTNVAANISGGVVTFTNTPINTGAGIVTGYHRAIPSSTTVSANNIIGSYTQQGNSVGVTISGGNKWTLGSAGIWSIYAKTYFYGAVNPGAAAFSITKNGSEFCNSIIDTAGYAGSNGDFSLGINCTAEFSANDYIQIKNLGDFTLISGTQVNSHITLVKLGVLT